MKFVHVGALPKWMLPPSVCGLNTSTKPRATSSTCVAKSTTARKMLRLAASLTPTMFRPTSMTITTMPPMMSHGFVLSGAQKIER